ncbi:MAG: hypothetical protein EHM39_10280 [Chloroflexi bacterium]|nr:MAG: hypothetical protein EHM39_10280 [Chloroflexota bacterium]
MMGLVWLGQASLPGVPARDLSADEARRYGGERRLIATGLYRRETLKAEEAKGETDDGRG